MSNRFQKFRQRLRKAWDNVKRLLKVGLRELTQKDRKAIVRALVALIIIAGVVAVGLLFLSGKPKRMVQANLTCKAVELPVPFRTVVRYGTSALRLWEYAGTAERCDRDSIQPKPAFNLPQRVATLQLIKTNQANRSLRITPEPPGQTGQRLDISSPSFTRLSIHAENNSSSVGAEASGLSSEIKLETMKGGQSTIQWVVDSQHIELWEDGLDIQPLGFRPEEQTTLKVSPFTDSAIDFKFNADDPKAAILAGFTPRPGAVVFELNNIAGVPNLQASECKSGSIKFDKSFEFPLRETTNEVRFEEIVLKEIGLKLSDDNPVFVISLSGKARKVFLEKEDKNPTRFEEVLSASPAKQTLFGLFVLGIIYLLGKLVDRAIEVLANTVIPDPAEPENKEIPRP